MTRKIVDYLNNASNSSTKSRMVLPAFIVCCLETMRLKTRRFLNKISFSQGYFISPRWGDKGTKKNPGMQPLLPGFYSMWMLTTRCQKMLKPYFVSNKFPSLISPMPGA